MSAAKSSDRSKLAMPRTSAATLRSPRRAAVLGAKAAKAALRTAGSGEVSARSRRNSA